MTYAYSAFDAFSSVFAIEKEIFNDEPINGLKKYFNNPVK